MLCIDGGVEEKHKQHQICCPQQPKTRDPKVALVKCGCRSRILQLAVIIRSQRLVLYLHHPSRCIVSNATPFGYFSLLYNFFYLWVGAGCYLYNIFHAGQRQQEEEASSHSKQLSPAGLSVWSEALEHVSIQSIFFLAHSSSSLSCCQQLPQLYVITVPCQTERQSSVVCVMSLIILFFSPLYVLLFLYMFAGYCFFPSRCLQLFVCFVFFIPTLLYIAGVWLDARCLLYSII